jgi:hypothetical protein
MSVKAIIVNRNLLSTLKSTIEFLRKEDRVKEIHILDQSSTYPLLLEWYKTIPEIVHYLETNNGPQVAWDVKYKHLRNEMFIIADPDCTYDNVPSDWLDVMMNKLQNNNISKVGFSLRIDDLPNTEIGNAARIHESKYWKNKIGDCWDAHVDTTFSLHKPNTPFTYDALRLDEPYTIKHVPWYITSENITEEWRYYLKHASSVSTWGSKLKLNI